MTTGQLSLGKYMHLVKTAIHCVTM